MSNHVLSWDRVLPAPQALLNGHANHELPRRSSSLLQHHLFSSKDLLDSSRDRRSTVPTLSYYPEPACWTANHPIPALKIARVSQDSSAPTSAPGPDQIVHNQLSKKRTASLMADEPKARGTSPATTQGSSSDNAGQFCLCQPDPKIPRPRNAFILYRQHHQAAVVTKHPGLPNPEISKIIGEEWRALPPKTKNQWKALAEEEKLRHQQQYPDYRYQPRRVGRNGNTQNSSTTGQTGPQGNCLRCGGRTMNAPVTPRTPGFTQNGGPGIPRSPPGLNGAGSQPLRRPPPMIENFHRTYAPTSPPRPGSAIARIRPFGEVFNGRSPISEAEYRARLASQPISPDPKRRRYNGPGVVVPPRGMEVASLATVYQPGGPYSPKRQFVSRPSEASMYHVPQRAMTTSSGSRPMYQNQGPRNGPVDAVHRDSNGTVVSMQSTFSSVSERGSVSAEVQIMSIPAVQKLRILSKAAPSLPSPGASNFSNRQSQASSRGAVLAIEGSEEDVRVMTDWLEEFLRSDSEDFLVKTFSGPDVDQVMAETSEVETQQERYLEAIRDWHRVSKDVVGFVSAYSAEKKVSASSSVSSQVTAVPPVDMKEDAMDVDEDSLSEPISPSQISPRTILRTETLALEHAPPAAPSLGQQPNHPSSSSTSASTARPSHQYDTLPPPPSTPMILDETPKIPLFPAPPIAIPTAIPTTTTASISTTTSTTTSHTTFPIALLPRYQLSTVDTASVAMQITDAYAPIDHWQWAAALWRGCVGPDVTIVIKGDAPSSQPSSASTADGLGPGSKDGSRNGSGSGSGNAGPAGVEVRLGGGNGDVRAVIVKKGNGAREIEAGALRRVGFEIVEFLRR